VPKRQADSSEQDQQQGNEVEDAGQRASTASLFGVSINRGRRELVNGVL
jgi:hypothetical protein